MTGHCVQDVMAEEAKEADLHLPRHQVQELWKINGTIAVSIHLVDHVVQLCLCGVLPKRSHHGAQLFCCDSAWHAERQGSMPP